MEFSTNRKEIAKLIKIVSSCVGSRNMLPILSNVMIEANENMVHFTCASLEQRVSAFCVADTAIKGATTVPAKKLLSLLNAMSGDEVDFAADDNHHASVTCGSSRVRLPGLPPGDFPEKAEMTAKATISINSSDLLRLFDHVSYAVGVDDARKTLTGILFNVHDNEITTVATDGTRLAYCPMAFTVPFETDVSFIIPLPAVQFLRSMKANEKITLEFSDKRVSTRILNIGFESKLIEGTFPNWKQVVPERFAKNCGNRQRGISRQIGGCLACLIRNADRQTFSMERASGAPCGKRNKRKRR